MCSQNLMGAVGEKIDVVAGVLLLIHLPHLLRTTL